MDNSIEFEPMQNIVELALVKVESVYEFVTPVQVDTKRREVGGAVAKVLSMKQHDTRTAIRALFKNPEGAAVDLTEATVMFTMAKKKVVLVSREAEIADPVNGRAHFIFQPGEVAEIGAMRAEFEVTYPDGSKEPFPNSGFITILFEKGLTEGGPANVV